MNTNDPRVRQAGFNTASCDQWSGFGPHRARVSELLAGGTGRGRLCVLGAGNGNDLDLPALLEAREEVHLVDLDSTALARAASRQGVAGHPRLRLFGGVDLTGMFDAFAGWTTESTLGPEDLGALVERPSCLVPGALAGPYDAVASTCLLSQLIGNAFHSVGENHPRFQGVVTSIRAGHLKLLHTLIAPGGAGILVTDVVSSDTCPALRTMPESALAALVPQLIRGRNFFHGVNPAALWSVFRNDLVGDPGRAELEALPPWRWRLHDRVYLVLAIRYRRGR